MKTSVVVSYFIFAIAIVGGSLAHAQSDNRRLVHQGRVLRPDGSPVQGSFQMEAKIYSPSPSRCLLWGESKVVSFNQGTFSFEIGDSLFRISGAQGGRSLGFPSAFINNASFAVNSAVCDSGTSYTPQNNDGRTMSITLYDGPQIIKVYEGPIRSVPYAIESSNATMVGGYTSDYIFKFNQMGSHKPTLTFSTLGASTVWELAENGNFGNRVLTGLANPVNPTDAVNLQSMNTAIASAISGGTTGTGVVTYLDAVSAQTGVMNISGGPVTSQGTLSFSFVSQTANTVFAAPTGSAGVPGFRTLEATDIPSLDAAKITSGTLPVARGGTGLGSFTPYALLAANMAGDAIEQRTCAAGDVLVWSATTGWTCEAKSTGTGSVTHVGFEASTIFDVTGAPITGSGTISLNFANQAQGLVLASPTGASGAPSFRALAGSDLPVVGGTGVTVSLTGGSLQISATGSGGTVTSVTAGTGLQGGVISSAGTLAVDVGLTDGKIVQVGTGDKIPVALIPNLDASIITTGTLATSRGGTGVDASAATDGQLLIGNGTGFTLNTLTAGTGISIVNSAGSISISSTLGGGTVTNVGLEAPTSVFTVAGSPVTGAGTMVIDFASQGAAMVFASPTGAAGVPTFRALSALDIPGLDASKIVSGTLSVGVGGTGLVPTAGDANKVYGLDATGLASEFKSLIAGTGVSITHGTGSMVISAAGSGGTVTSVTAGTGLLGGVISSAGTLAVDVGLTDGKIVQVSTGDKIPVALIPNLDASIITTGTLATSRGGTGLDASAATDGQILIGNGSGFTLNTLTAGTGISIVNSAGSISISSTLGGGTVTNVGLEAPTSVFTVANSPVTGAGTMVIDFASQGAAMVFASPTGAAGVPTFRALSASDIPGLDASKIVSGTLGVGVGGTGLVPSAGDANKVYGLDATGLASEFKDIIAGTGVSITHGAGSMVISAAGSGGTVTNIGALVPSFMTVSPAAITSSGTFDFSFNSQAAALVFASPTGAAGAPSFRALAGSDLPILAGTGVNVTLTGGSLEISSSLAGGTVTNVGLEAPTSVFTVANSPVTGAGTMVIDFASQGAAQVFASPTGAAGVPTFRALSALDIPGLDASKIVSGTLGVGVGGTGLVPTAGDANKVYGLDATGLASEFKSLIAGTGVSITHGTGSMVISAAGSGGTVTSVTAGTGLLGGVISSAGTLAVDVGLTDGKIVQVGTGDKIPVALIPNLDASIITTGTLATARGGTGVDGSAATDGQLLIGNGTGFSLNTLTAGTGISIVNTAGSISISSTLGGGTVTNVGLTAPTSVFSVTGSPVTGAGTMVVDFAQQGAATVFAAPTGATGVPTFRALSASDIPGLDASKITSGTLGVGVGGTGLVPTAGDANKVYGLDATGLASEFKDIVAGTGVSITHGTGSMVISAAGSGGTVTNIGAIVPSFMTVSPAAITSSGTFDFSFNSQAAALVFASPTGASGAPVFRALAASDIPALDASKITSGTLPVSLGGTGLSSYTPYALFASNMTGDAIEQRTCSAGEILVWQVATGWTCEAKGSGSVSNVGLTAPTSVFTVTGSPVTGAGTMVVDFSQQGAATVFAAPTGATGVPTFRALASEDIPGLDASKITSGTLGVNRGGTGLVPAAGDANQIYGVNAAGSAAEFKTLVAGTGLSISHSAGTISLSMGSTGVGQWLNNTNGIHYLAGSVGIGTATPDSKLSLVGDMNIDGNFYGTGIVHSGYNNSGGIANGFVSYNSNAAAPGVGASYSFFGDTNGNSKMADISAAWTGNSNDDAYLAFNTMTSDVNTEKLRITANGKVGIGTPNPSVALDIVATGTLGSAIRFPRATTAMRPVGSAPGDLQGMMRYNTDLHKYEVYEGTTGWTSLSTGTAGASQWTSVTNGIHYSAGSVGIGTNAPSEALEVIGNLKVKSDEPYLKLVDQNSAKSSTNMIAGIEIRDSANSQAGFLHFDSGDGNTDFILGVDTSATGGLRFNTDNSTRMYLSGRGLLGIGTTTPTVALDVSMTGTLGSAIRIPRDTQAMRPVGSAAGDLQGMMRYNTDLHKYEVYEGTTGWASLSTGTAGASQWTSVASGIHYSNGSVGIGTATPGAALEVDGDILAESIGNGVRQFVFYGAFIQLDGDLIGSGGAESPYIYRSGAGAAFPTYAFNGSDDTGMYLAGTDSLGFSTAGTNRMQILDNGKIGIGTGTPTAALDVVATGTLGSAIRFPRATSAMRPVGSAAGDLQGMMRYNTDLHKYEVYEGTTGWASLATGTAGTSQWTSVALGINYSSGSVGIGVASPAQPLHVNGNARIDGQLTFGAGPVAYISSLGIFRAAGGNAGGPGLSFQNDPNTGLFNPSTDELAFATNGAERMRIDSNGNTGIGTTAPTVALDVVATGTLGSAIRFPRASSAMRPVGSAAGDLQGMMRYNTDLHKYEVYEGTTGWASLSTGTAGTSQWTNNANGIHYSSGSVGIGTTLPSYNLSLSGATNQTIGVERQPTAATAGSHLTISAGASASGSTNTIGGNLYLASGADTGAGNNSSIQLQTPLFGSSGTSPNPPQTLMRLFRTQVIIGELAGGQLDVNGGMNIYHYNNTSSGAQLNLTNSRGYTSGQTQANDYTGSINFTGTNSAWAGLTSATITSQATNVTSGAVAGNLAFSTSRAGALAERMRIHNNGNVGIGTTAPTVALDVNVTGTLGSAIRIPRDTQANRPVGSSAADLRGMMRYNTDNNKYEVYEDSAWASLSTGTAGASQWTNVANGIHYSSGSVGIGTSSPSRNLEISANDANTGIRVVNTTSTATRGPNIAIRNYTNGNGGSPYLELFNSGGTQASPAAVVNNQNLGTVGFIGGYDTSGGYALGASIVGAADGNFSGTSTPGRILFNTTPTGSTSEVERMRITSGGSVGIGTSSPTAKLDVSGNVNVSGTINANQAFVTLTDGATITWTVAGIINNATVTLGGNRTLAFSGLTNGMTGTIIVKQDATGSRTLTLPAQCTNRVVNGGGATITLTTTANAIDILTFVYDGTNCYWTYGKNFN